MRTIAKPQAAPGLRSSKRALHPRPVADADAEVRAKLADRLVLLVADALGRQGQLRRDVGDRVPRADHLHDAPLPAAQHAAGGQPQRLALLGAPAVAGVAVVGDDGVQAAEAGPLALVP